MPEDDSLCDFLGFGPDEFLDDLGSSLSRDSGRWFLFRSNGYVQVLPHEFIFVQEEGDRLLLYQGIFYHWVGFHYEPQRFEYQFPFFRVIRQRVEVVFENGALYLKLIDHCEGLDAPCNDDKLVLLPCESQVEMGVAYFHFLHGKVLFQFVLNLSIKLLLHKDSPEVALDFDCHDFFNILLRTFNYFFLLLLYNFG